MEKIKIIIAEDSDFVRDGMRIILDVDADFEVLGCARNGQEAIELARKNVPDIILMDISMPVMDGIEATKRIRAMDRSDAHMVPIIALTANAFDKDIQRSKVAGMNEHLTKPLDSGKLFQTLIDFWQQA